MTSQSLISRIIPWNSKELALIFYFIDFYLGLRFVRSYPFIFEVHIKERWIGRNAVEVLNQEYRGHSLDYYVRLENTESRASIALELTERDFLMNSLFYSSLTLYLSCCHNTEGGDSKRLSSS